MSVGFVFVVECDHHLEWQGVLLAASIRRHLGQKPAIYCYIPESDRRPMLSSVKKALKRLGVTFGSFSNAGLFNGAYPHGNKILACAQARPEQNTVFLDTDMVVVDQFDLDAVTASGVMVAPADRQTWGTPEQWRKVYDLFELPTPASDFRLRNGTLSCPYYNAGLVCFANNTNLGATWLRVASRIDFAEIVDGTRPSLDQISLPIACQIIGLPVQELGHGFNFNPNVNRKTVAAPAAKIVHYHQKRRLITTGYEKEASRTLALMTEFPNLDSLVAEVLPKQAQSQVREKAASAPRQKGEPELPTTFPGKLKLACQLSPNKAALDDVLAGARTKLGYLSKHFPRFLEYPWVLDRIRSLPKAGLVADIGAGVSPIPPILASDGVRVHTFDASRQRRSWDNQKEWSAWGFLDYGVRFPGIQSYNEYFSAKAAGGALYDAIYSVSVVEHTPKSARVDIWNEASKCLAEDGRLIFTLDLHKNTNDLWNLDRGRVVEDQTVHGDVDMIRNELKEAGFVQDYVETHRGIPFSKTDLLFFSARRSRRKAMGWRARADRPGTSDGVPGAPAVSRRMTEVFNGYYENNTWRGGLDDGTRSGRGSTLEFTENFRGFLAKFVAENNIRSILDAPCGDFHWMKEVPLPPGVRYIGGDIASVLIGELNAQYGSATREFLHFDIVTQAYPDVDVWLCRDVFIHLPLELCVQALRKACDANITYAMLTSVPKKGPNRPGVIGGARPVDLLKAPFNLPAPLSRCEEIVMPGRAPRFLGVWRMDDIRAALARPAA